MLKIENLRVETLNGHKILENVNLHIPRGETYILFGPNGSGKTSLMMAIMGFSSYKVTRGKIIFKGKDVTNMPIYERAKLGIGVSFQRPPTIHGLPTKKMVEICAGGKPFNIDESAKNLNFTQFLDRDVNHNLSGGEIKRSELLQLLAQNPDLLLLDEPESGVDLENIVLLGDMISKLLGRSTHLDKCTPHNKILEHTSKSALVITHTGHILEYINADRGQVLYDGVLCCSRNPREILKWIREYGYKECVRCSK